MASNESGIFLLVYWVVFWMLLNVEKLHCTVWFGGMMINIYLVKWKKISLQIQKLEDMNKITEGKNLK